MNIAIIEDIEEWAKKIECEIQKTLRREDTRIKHYISAQQFLKDRKKYEIVFMDISLNGISGLEETVKYKSQFPESIVMLVTSYKEYYREGYKVEAFRCIEKEYLEEEIQEGLEHALIKLKRYQTIKINILNYGKIKLRYKDIIYIESTERKTIFHTEQEIYETHEKISELTKLLEEAGFYRCEKSYLINLDWVDKIISEKLLNERKVLLKNKEKIPLGLKKKKELLEKLNDWRLCL